MGSKHVMYSQREKLLLPSLIKEHPIVLNKRTDAATVLQKQKEWDQLAEQYNAHHEVTTKRTSTQLRKLWNNLKQQKRLLQAKQKYAQLLTGTDSLFEFVTPDDPLIEAVESVARHIDDEIDHGYDFSKAVYVKGESRISVSEQQNETDQVASTSSTDPITPTPNPKPKRKLAFCRQKSAVPGRLLRQESRLRMNGIRSQNQLNENILKIQLEMAQEQLMREKEISKLQVAIAKEQLQKAECERRLAELKLKRLNTEY